ncbi:hypothetical protein JCM8097_008504 [Rhodosporidiobolus ruineniae]
MAYNPNHYYGAADNTNYQEHLAHPAQQRYSDDPFGTAQHGQPYAPQQAGQQPFAAMPMTHDPEMEDLTTRDRPLSESAFSDGTNGASAYWAPGARGSVGGVAGAGGFAGEEWEDPYGGEGSLWRRRRGLIIGGIVAAVALLAIALGVGLGVGLNSGHKNNNSDAARVSGDRASSGSAGPSVSTGLVVYTSTSYGSGGVPASTETGTSTTEAPLFFLLYYDSATVFELFDHVRLKQYNSAYLELEQHDHSSGSDDLVVDHLFRLIDPPRPAEPTSSDAPTSTTTSAPAAQSPPTSTDDNGGVYVFTTRPIVNPGGFTVGTLTGYVTVTAT